MKVSSLILLILLLLMPAPGFAKQSADELTQRGNEAFGRGEHETAASLYDQAMEAETGKAVLLYNKANALYKMEKYEEAVQLYQKAINSNPSRKLLGLIYFNAGNAYLKLADQQTSETLALTDLQKSLGHYEKSFEMYRQSLETSRAISIAEGRNVESAGQSARHNWAIARQLWTDAWEKIRELERKDLKLEDAIDGILKSQLTLLPNLERVYLNSYSDDILNFNLKRLAEYQDDYKEEFINLKTMAAAETERIQTEIDNQKAQAQQQAATPQGGQDKDTASLESQLENAVQIQKAIEQIVALDEWIVDALKRNEPILAWQKSSQIIGLLKDLASYLKKGDPALPAYQNLIMTIGDIKNLAEKITPLKDLAAENENAALALTKRSKLITAKGEACVAELNKINFYLSQIKAKLQEQSSPISDDNATATEQSPPVPAGGIEAQLKNAKEQLAAIIIDTLSLRNDGLSKQLAELDSTSPETISNLAIEKQQDEASKAFIWYQHLKLSIEEVFIAQIKKTEELEDFINNSIAAASDQEEKQRQAAIADLLKAKPDEEKMNILLFSFENLITLLDKSVSDGEKSANQELEGLVNRYRKAFNQLDSSWKNYQQGGSITTLADLRLKLIAGLLQFSPDTAIALYYERTQQLYKQLEELLPANETNATALQKRHRTASFQAENLKGILKQYFAGLKESLAENENQESKNAHLESIAKQEKALPLMERAISADQDATVLLAEKKLQQAELLFRDASATVTKSALAFMQEPSETEKQISLAIELQKKLEEQSRFAGEAATIEGNPAKLAKYGAANQTDIIEMVENGKESIEQTIGMAGVPTHGQQAPDAGAPEAEEQIDTDKLKEVQEKLTSAQDKMAQVKSFIEAAEFHNTFDKHPPIIQLLQEALDLLKNKDEQKKDGEDGEKNQDKEGEQEQQQQPQQSPNQDGQQGQNGQDHPKKPLELTASEARELLKELNQQDANQTELPAAKGNKSFSTPRPW